MGNNTFVALKHGADFMMLASYALMFCGLMSVPLLSRVAPLSETRAWCVRHMSADPEFTNDTIMYKTWTGFAIMIPVYILRGEAMAIPYVFACGLMQAFTMEFPLFVFGIRPFDTE